MSAETTNDSGPEVGVFYYVTIDPETRIVQCAYQLFSRPTAENFVEITKDDFENFKTMPGAKVDEKGILTPYQPPVTPESMKTQASAAMMGVQSQAAMTTAMGQVFGPNMRAYVQKLRDIINGTDTTSTTLPTVPADPTT